MDSSKSRLIDLWKLVLAFSGSTSMMSIQINSASNALSTANFATRWNWHTHNQLFFFWPKLFNILKTLVNNRHLHFLEQIQMDRWRNNGMIWALKEMLHVRLRKKKEKKKTNGRFFCQQKKLLRNASRSFWADGTLKRRFENNQLFSRDYQIISYLCSVLLVQVWFSY